MRGEFITLPMWVYILSEVALKEGKSIRKIIRNASNYAHGFNIIKKLEKKGFIFFKKEGREKKTFLTEKGRKAAKSCSELIYNLKWQ